MSFSTDQIDDLIGCIKEIDAAPSKEFKEENRHRRKDMRLRDAGDRTREFNVFIRQSLEFAEDFSIGLIYSSPEGKRITLIRYNGQHEQSNDPFSAVAPHFQYHIHKATPDNLNNGRFEKHPARITDSYGSFEEAIREFLFAVGLSDGDIAKYFPGLGALPLFDGMRGNP